MAENIYKRGEEIVIFLQTNSEIEWNNLYPFDAVKCEAEIPKQPDGEQEYLFTVVPDIPNQRFILTAVTNDAWPVGSYKLDVRVTRGGKHRFYPSGDKYETFTIVRPVTDDEV